MSMLHFQYLKVSHADWPFPQLEGSCGRLLIYRHPGKPLRSLLNAPWNKRADFAVQILQLIESFVVRKLNCCVKCKLHD